MPKLSPEARRRREAMRQHELLDACINPDCHEAGRCTCLPADYSALRFSWGIPSAVWARRYQLGTEEIAHQTRLFWLGLRRRRLEAHP
jgi:hypothetical protein